ncbi:MAG: type I restriction enzyme HsdR N-terminal domain-containing protein [Flavobacteriia bacterium]|jgi:hypothetical protein|nr:type I restriction enzyme HsdR N-terminal domain-containing protein [Flavobacteriia bacterium]NBV68526.1 type I restriction enzyme HsdR N-terminal domain-containing protein [Flavobacteriia bacterium]NBV90742.1 type I restriction enzyme HsdR N-terminal domain-containing protein [Flavobacteriia bacterium]NBY40769.1 type I restriction enzyme HsdR N-terminal domain-containing protein [Flavobacteriia bacterium]
MMQPLTFPPTVLKLKKVGEQVHVFCLIRKKWLVLTPEEWVRQHVIGFLSDQRKVPLSLIAVEKGFLYNGKKKRWDIVTYDPQGNPKILVECKQTNVGLSTPALLQVSSYQKIIQSDKIVVTNGLDCFVYEGQEWKDGIHFI